MVDDEIKMSGEADYRFLSLVMSLATAAWSQLGKVPNPATQKIEKDIDQARMSIEFLRMIQEKTEGNLSVKEQELIDNTVADLELNFADEVRKSETASDKAAADKSTQTDSAAEARQTSGGAGPDIILPHGAGGKAPEIIKP
jgi:F0F1-type ATP synthase membrane subunit b/b'